MAWYRLRLRFRVHPVQRVQRTITGAEFFRELGETALPSGQMPEAPSAWLNEAVYFGWHAKPLPRHALPPDWHRNPFTQARIDADDIPWWALSDFDTSVGDIKTVWEASRFDWVLAFAQRGLTGESDSIERLNQWVADWCHQNPCYCGPNWKCAQEASIRVIHLALAAHLLGQERDSTESLLALVEAHLARIRPTLAYARAQDNNHGTSEAAALYIGGYWLAHKGMSVGLNYAALGRRHLEERVARLIATDGAFAQYSVNYHRLALDTLSIVELWRRWLELPPFSDGFYERAKAAARWLSVMTDGQTGDAPNLGANDGANLLPLTSADYRDYRPAVQLALAMFAGERGFTRGGPHDDHLAWLGVATPRRASQPERECPDQFDEGGFAVLRRDGWRAVFRYPRYRFRPSHCDALHVDLWHYGENLLRDGGSYSYNAEGQWRRYFAGPAAHNTIEFDERDAMPVLSRFLRGAWLKANSVACSTDESEGQVAQAAYTDWQGERHLRQISLSDAGLTVRDEISGFGEKAVLRWRLAPGEWVLTEDGVRSPHYFLRVIADSPITRIELVEGWESRYYLHKSPIPVLEVEVAAAGTLETRFTAAAATQSQ